MRFSLLADHPHEANTVAQWYFDEWCKESGRYPFEFVQKNVAQATNTDKPPLLVLCHLDNT